MRLHCSVSYAHVLNVGPKLILKFTSGYFGVGHASDTVELLSAEDNQLLYKVRIAFANELDDKRVMFYYKPSTVGLMCADISDEHNGEPASISRYIEKVSRIQDFVNKY